MMTKREHYLKKSKVTSRVTDTKWRGKIFDWLVDHKNDPKIFTYMERSTHPLGDYFFNNPDYISWWQNIEEIAEALGLSVDKTRTLLALTVRR